MLFLLNGRRPKGRRVGLRGGEGGGGGGNAGRVADGSGYADN